VNIFQLNCFLAVANYLSFGKAAQSLNISQPAITHQIKTLEEELNVKLFNRSTRLVELTLEGQAFVSDAKSMVSIAERAKMRFQNPEERPLPVLTIGGSSYHNLACLASSLRQLSDSVENLHPRLQVASHDQLFHMLENDSLDMVFEIGDDTPSKGIVYRPLCTSAIVCVCHRQSGLAESGNISPELLRQEKLILCDPLSLSPKVAEMQWKLAEGRNPADIHFSSSVDASMVMALAGFGAAILPEVLVPPGDALTKIAISDSPIVPLGIFYKAHPGDDILRQFVQIARKNFQEISPSPSADEI
jgi:DNA-binding transcriptional LysR family regulator